MAKSEHQKLKMLYLCRLFAEQTDENHGVTTEQIIDYLESKDVAAERKAIYRDITLLTEFGMDIQKSKKGQQTYYYLESRDFELSELKLLVDAVSSSRFLTVKQTNELISKLERLTSTYNKQALQRQVFVQNRVKSVSGGNSITNIDHIYEAIVLGRKISFRYGYRDMKHRMVYKKNGGRYCISPWFMTWAEERYYLIAYDSEAEKIKHFRVDRMREVACTEEARDGGELFGDFDVAEYCQRHFNMYSGPQISMKLLIPATLTDTMFDRFGEGVNMRQDPTDKDKVILNAKVAESDQLAGWILGFGGDIEVLEPASLKERLYRIGETMVNKYGNRKAER